MAKRILAVIAIALFLCSSAFADGMIVRPDTDYWRPYRQTQQNAIINYENGFENLLLFVSTDYSAQTEKFVWIFPVPAQPQSIGITNLKGFPVLSGTPLKQQLKDNLGSLALFNFAAVFPPLALVFLASPVYYSMGTEAPTSGMAETKNAPDRGYEIWSHVSKYGISTEVMTAWDSEKFYHYLEVRGANIEPEAKKYIEEFMGKNYSFIVSWVSNPIEYQQGSQSIDAECYGPGCGYYGSEPIGVFVKFPTEKIVYPLKMTSVYRDDYVPMTIDVIGYHKPVVFKNISKETKNEYYFNGEGLQYGLNEEESLNAVLNGKIPEQLRFTRISINAQAKYFTQDLEISSLPSVSGIGLEIVNSLWVIIAIIIFFLLSFAAVLFVNKIALQNVLNQKRIALLALSNFLTIIGFIVAVFILKEQLKGKEKAKFKRLLAIPIFWGTFFGIAILFGVFALIVGIVVK